MNQKKVRLLKKLARSLGLPYKVLKKRYQGFNAMQRREMAKEMRRLEKDAPTIIKQKQKEPIISERLEEETRKRRVEPMPLEETGMTRGQKLKRRIQKLWKK